MKLNKMCVLQNITPRHKGRDHKQWGTFFKMKRGRKGEGSTPHIEIQNGIGIQNSMESQYKQSPTGTDRDQKVVWRLQKTQKNDRTHFKYPLNNRMFGVVNCNAMLAARVKMYFFFFFFFIIIFFDQTRDSPINQPMASCEQNLNLIAYSTADTIGTGKM